MSVDLRVGFCSEGPLSSPRVGALVPEIVDLFTRAFTAGVRDFVLTQDSHPPDAPEFREFGPHCVTGTREAETVPELLALPFSREFKVIRKRSLSSAESTELIVSPAWDCERAPECCPTVAVTGADDIVSELLSRIGRRGSTARSIGIAGLQIRFSDPQFLKCLAGGPDRRQKRRSFRHEILDESLGDRWGHRIRLYRSLDILRHLRLADAIRSRTRS